MYVKPLTSEVLVMVGYTDCDAGTGLCKEIRVCKETQGVCKEIRGNRSTGSRSQSLLPLFPLTPICLHKDCPYPPQSAADCFSLSAAGWTPAPFSHPRGVLLESLCLLGWVDQAYGAWSPTC